MSNDPGEIPERTPPSLGQLAADLEAWLLQRPELIESVRRPLPVYADRVAAMRAFMGELHAAGWSRYGWPVDRGGLGGSILHRGAMWEVLSRGGVPTMAVYEHLEVLAPTLVLLGPADFVAEHFPLFLSGQQLWSQGFSEPDAGSDLANLRTVAVADGDVYRITGRKIWTSWSRYADWCLLLARTGEPGSRHRGLTAFIVDLHAPGVEVRAITQANGTDELAEVFFDDVEVPANRIVGELNGGWKVAMHILSHERGTFAWFRHLFLYGHLDGCLDLGSDHSDAALGNALVDLAAVTATGLAGLDAHANATPLGAKAAFTKLLLCAAEQSVNDWVYSVDSDLAAGVQDDATTMLRQEYLFSRIVTVYGGSQQMQLETISKQILELS